MFISIALLLVGLFLMVLFGLPLSNLKGLPILMYHKVSLNSSQGSTISVKKLETQFKYLAENGYTCVPLNSILYKANTKLPKRAFALTFDDAYLNNLVYAYPLLQKYNLHATIMLPVGFIGKTNGWDAGNEVIMNYHQLRSFDSRFVSFALHTYGHIFLNKVPFNEITTDLEKCQQELKDNNIDFLSVLAYPYGSYPRDKDKKGQFFKLLEKMGITHGLRIGNGINKWPLKNRYEVKRIDIKGEDSIFTFKTKLRKGRVRAF